MNQIKNKKNDSFSFANWRWVSFCLKLIVKILKASKTFLIYPSTIFFFRGCNYYLEKLRMTMRKNKISMPARRSAFLHTGAKLRALCVSVVIFFSLSSYSQNPEPSFFTHISLNGFYSNYNNNKNHTDKTQQLLSYSLAVREEWRFSHGVALVGGAEFFAHGLKFDSYYFAPGKSFLYDKKFSYHYKLNMYEANIPLLIRGNFQGRKRGSAVGYFEIGPTLRYLISSNLNVTDDAAQVITDQSTSVSFEYPVIKKNMSVFMQFNTGIQFYHGDHWSGFFMELNFRYAPIRFTLDESFTPNSLYIQNFHAGLGIGLRI